MKFKEIPQLTSIGSYQINMPLPYINKTIQEWETDVFNKLQLNTDFQRGHVWTENQQISYVEFLLKGGKSSRVIYFNKPSWQGQIDTDYDDFVCVDGLQRLTAVIKFMDNKLKAFGNYCHEFEDRLPTKIDLLFNVNNLQTKKEVLQWYIEFNSGGTPHTNEEIERVKLMLEQEQK